MKVAVMGAGAVGSYIGAMLARAGHDVTLIARPQHVEAVKANGLVLESRSFHGSIPVQATAEASGVEGADVVLLCVKSSDTESAGRAMATSASRGARAAPSEHQRTVEPRRLVPNK